MKTNSIAVAVMAMLAPASALAQGEPLPSDEPSERAPEAPTPAADEKAASQPTKQAERTTPPPVDDALMAELNAAASADAAVVANSRGSASIASEQRDEDPMTAVLGKEVVGNESNPSISLILDATGAYFSHEERVLMEGHAPATNGPVVQGAELAISAPVDPFFRVDLAYGLYHAEVEEAYLTTTSLPWNLQLRAGQFKAHVGRHNPTHLHTWDFVVHPLPNQYLFGAESLKGPGAELSVLLPLPWYVEVVGALQTGEAGSFSTKSQDYGDPSVKDFIYPVRVVQFLDLGDDWGLQLGLNTVQGTSAVVPESGNRSEAYGADAFLKWRPIGDGNSGYTYVKWTAEVWTRRMQVPDDVWRDLGGYSELVFGLGKGWNTGVRGELWRRTAGDRPSVDNDRATYGVDVERGSAMLSYMPSHFSRVRLQYTLEHAEVLGMNHQAFLQLEVSAGAHGAHSY